MQKLNKKIFYPVYYGSMGRLPSWHFTSSNVRDFIAIPLTSSWHCA